MIKDVIQEMSQELQYNFSFDTTFEKIENGLQLKKENGILTVKYASNRELARALLLAKMRDGEESYDIEENSSIETLCFMVDCSRNAVLNVDTVKKLIRNISALGYNSLMLYTEDTFEVENEPFFGYLRGRYTQDEIKEIDAYAKKFGIELIPCIQTLAHLNTIVKYKEYAPHIDLADVLLVGDERTYQLIENIFKTLSKTFTSRRVQIGMDEAYFLGRGKYADKNGSRERFDIFIEHLEKVCEIAQKYGFEPIMWSDMFWALGKRRTGEYSIPQDVIPRVPKSVSVCYWDYYNLGPDMYEHMFSIHKGFAKPIWFAGGSWKWLGMIPANGFSFATMDSAFPVVEKYGIKNLINTAWGDNGAEASVFSILPSIAYFSLKAMGYGETEIKKEFFALTGYTFDDFMKIEYPNNRAGKAPNERANPTKYALFNDAFSGVLDVKLDEEEREDFLVAAKALQKMGGQYAYMFKSASALANVLYDKYDLGILLRRAYQANDKETLLVLTKRMDKIIRKLRRYIQLFREQWYQENKTYGFEIQEYRLGGLIERIRSCKKRVAGYCQGEIERIAELEDVLLPEPYSVVWADKRYARNGFINIASVNIF